MDAAPPDPDAIRGDGPYAPSLGTPESTARAIARGALSAAAAFVAAAVATSILTWRPCGPGPPDSAPLFVGMLAAVLVASLAARRHMDRTGVTAALNQSRRKGRP